MIQVNIKTNFSINKRIGKKEWDCVMSNDSSPQGPGPIAPSLVCDTFHPRLLLFGGWIGHCVINDLWAFHYCMYFWIPKNNEKKKK